MSFSGTIQDGIVIFDAPPQLPNGTRVEVTPSETPDQAFVKGAASIQELDGVLNELTALTPPAQSLPVDFGRGDLYADHD